MQLPDRAALVRALRVRRNQILLAVFALLLAVRIALPYALRPIIVEQADQALVGRIALRDLDLSLIRGGVTLHGLEVFPDELPPPGTVAKPPLFAAERLWINISWLELILKTIDVEEFALDGFTVRLDRLKDGLVLPKPAPSTEPAPPAPEPAAPSSWTFAADSVSLTKGAIHFSDFTLGDAPQRLDLQIPNLAARELALRFDPAGREPGHIALELDIGGGKIAFEGDLEQKPAGPATHSKTTLTNLPIGSVRVYLKMFGWSDLTGTLDASIEHRFETDGPHEVSGSLSLSDVSVRVPKLDRPALAFKKLAVALEKVDLVNQHAAVSDVRLLGAHVVIDPKSKNPVLLLEPPAKAAPAEPPAPEPTPGPPAKPWTWNLARLGLEDAVVELLGAADPLALGVDAELKSLASPTTGTSPLSLAVREGDGSLKLAGDLTLEPLGWSGKLALRDFALAPLAARAPAPGAGLLRGGKARADLEVTLARKAGGAPGAADLRVAGTLGIAGLEVGRPGDRDFAIAWKDLAISLHEVTVAPALGGDSAAPRAVALALDRVQLVEPAISLARTANGIALPDLGGAPAPAAAAPATPAAAPASPPAPAPTITAKLEKLKLERGRLSFSDRSVKPFYDGRVEQLDVVGSKLRWPPAAVDAFVVDLRGLHGAVLHVHGGISQTRSRVRVELTALPLAPFNPYVVASGYALSDGTLELKAKATLENGGYDSSTDVKIQSLEIGGAEGEALFEENFGLPLSMALGLLKDQEGAIALSVPVAGDREGMHVGLASLAGQALRKALVGALASPLKLLGIGAGGDKIELKPEPIPFVPGGETPSEAGDARIDQLGVLLASAPGISLTLHGGTSEGDERALRERALLAELERTSGLRALASLGEIGTRRAVRLYLQASAKGEKPAALEPDQAAWLESKIAAQPTESGALEALAAKRAAALSERLVAGHGVDASRVVVGAPAPALSLPIPGVAIDVGARTPASH
ncbi:MAG: DUF748 domain-containing protein [Myxococcota bacterium]